MKSYIRKTRKISVLFTILGFFAILRFLPPFLGNMASMRVVQLVEARRLM